MKAPYSYSKGSKPHSRGLNPPARRGSPLKGAREDRAIEIIDQNQSIPTRRDTDSPSASSALQGGSPICRGVQPPAPAPPAPQGAIFKIERLAVHDGPGIRTVVFLKGCPMRCVWCSSPESQSPEPELLFDRRNGAQTLNGRIATLDDIMAEIRADEVFYYRSGGGVTLSGGEPMAQPAFARAILEACAHIGIHTAMETAGLASWDTLRSMLPFLDLLYYDLKHMDTHAHQRLTGVSNERILDNFKRAASFSALPVIVRIPLVPGLNDSSENIEATARFVAEAGGVERMELLPYHRYGMHRYELLGREYGLRDLQGPTPESVNALVEIVASFGLKVQTGG